METYKKETVDQIGDIIVKWRLQASAVIFVASDILNNAAYFEVR